MIPIAQRAMRRHLKKIVLVGVLALAWSSFFLGYADHPGAENEAHFYDGRRSLRALADYFDPASHAPYDDHTITVYTVRYPSFSLFETGMLDRYGSGRFNYDLKAEVKCDRSCRMPVTNGGPCIVATREKDCPEKLRQCNFPQCKVMLQSDEKCQFFKLPHDIRAYYTAVSTAAYLPLGPRSDSWKAFETIQAQPGFAMKPSSQRDYAFNAIFSQDTDESRQQLAQIINQHRLSSRSGLPVFSTMPTNWTMDVNDPQNSHLDTFAYMNALLDSVFTLSPAGHNPECYRLYEAVEAGSIPVLVKKDLTEGKTHKCIDSLHHWRDAPIVKLDSWDDLFPTVERLMEDKEALDQMQMDLLAWYGDYMHRVVVDFEDFMRDSYVEKGGEEEGSPDMSLAAGEVQKIDGPAAGEAPEIDSLAVGEASLGLQWARRLAEDKTPETGPCDDIILFVPDIHLSLGRQLNHYLLAVVMATFMNKAMVILDAPKDSICPGGGVDYPLDFSSIVEHPEWLTRECAVPCQATRGYSDWETFRHETSDVSPMTPCMDDGGKRADVVVVGGDETPVIFDKYFKNIMKHRSSSVAADWALRVGATPVEAEAFSKLEGDAMLDYIGALLVRSGVLQFQDSIKADSVEHVRTDEVYRKGRYHESFDAVQILRGEDALADPEAKKYIDEYWDARGYDDQAARTSLPDYIPTLQYLRHYDGRPCSNRNRRVYVATDDPLGVERELAELGRDGHGYLRLNNCQALKIRVSPVKSDPGTGDNCAARYANTVAAIANFIMLSNADAFVGEFLSDWGRLVRVFRLELNPEAGTISDGKHLRPLQRFLLSQNSEAASNPSPVSLRNTNVAWGYLRPPTPL